MTAIRLERLLNRRATGIVRGVMPDYEFMAGCMLAGDVTLALHRVPDEAVMMARRLTHTGTRAETAQHSLLKHAAAEWMRLSGARDAKTEVWMSGYRIDAYSRSKAWAVECGQTDPIKLVDLSSALDRPQRIMAIPYQGGPSLWAVEFIISETVADALSARDAAMPAVVFDPFE